MWKGTSIEVKIRETRIDKTAPNIAKVFFSAKASGGKLPQVLNIDSEYFMVFKEDGTWKMNTLRPLRENK